MVIPADCGQRWGYLREDGKKPFVTNELQLPPKKWAMVNWPKQALDSIEARRYYSFQTPY